MGQVVSPQSPVSSRIEACLTSRQRGPTLRSRHLHYPILPGRCLLRAPARTLAGKLATPRLYECEYV
jgi:hypothetical protein